MVHTAPAAAAPSSVAFLPACMVGGPLPSPASDGASAGICVPDSSMVLLSFEALLLLSGSAPASAFVVVEEASRWIDNVLVSSELCVLALFLLIL